MPIMKGGVRNSAAPSASNSATTMNVSALPIQTIPNLNLCVLLCGAAPYRNSAARGDHKIFDDFGRFPMWV
jgi:hypothetical protein